jgi:hypothetical protein
MNLRILPYIFVPVVVRDDIHRGVSWIYVEMAYGLYLNLALFALT